MWRELFYVVKRTFIKACITQYEKVACLKYAGILIQHFSVLFEVEKIKGFFLFNKKDFWWTKGPFKRRKKSFSVLKTFFSSSSHLLVFLGSFHFSSFAARYIEISLWDVEAKGFWKQEIRPHWHYQIKPDISTMVNEWWSIFTQYCISNEDSHGLNGS